MFRIIKHILLLGKDTLSKYMVQFFNDGSIY